MDYRPVNERKYLSMNFPNNFIILLEKQKYFLTLPRVTLKCFYLGQRIQFIFYNNVFKSGMTLLLNYTIRERAYVYL